MVYIRAPCFYWLVTPFRRESTHFYAYYWWVSCHVLWSDSAPLPVCKFLITIFQSVHKSTGDAIVIINRRQSSANTDNFRLSIQLVNSAGKAHKADCYQTQIMLSTHPAHWQQHLRSHWRSSRAHNLGYWRDFTTHLQPGTLHGCL